MRHLVLALLATAFVTTAASAVDLGKAEGTLTVDNKKLGLGYAYAVGHQRNQLSRRNDDIRIILTDKALPDGVKLDELDYAFPEGYVGVVACVTHDNRVAHIVVQHPGGTYDADYFENDQNYRFKPAKGESGTVSGNLSSTRMTTNTMTFFFNVDFSAPLK
jgi:hypothetical protein